MKRHTKLLTFAGVAALLVLALAVLIARPAGEGAADVPELMVQSYYHYEDGILTVYLGLSPQEDGPIQTREDVESVTLTVMDSQGEDTSATVMMMDARSKVGTLSLTPSEAPEPLDTLSPEIQDENALWYAADATSFLQGKSYHLYFYDTITAGDGLVFDWPGYSCLEFAYSGRRGHGYYSLSAHRE